MKRGERGYETNADHYSENDGEDEQETPMSTLKRKTSILFYDNLCRRGTSREIFPKDGHGFCHLGPHERRRVVQEGREI